jgi:hypothetical protein
MSFYTTQLRFPLEQCLKDNNVDNLEENWKVFYKQCGLNDYPIFDEAYREHLNNVILRRYYFREIGFETMGQFAFMMRRTMHEIMPFYNKLYTSVDLVKNLLWDKDLNHDEVWTVDNDNKSESETTNDNTATSHDTTNNENVFQDTPMNALDSGDVKNKKYATSVTYDDTTNDGTTNSKGSTNFSGNEVKDEDGTRSWHEYGYTESPINKLLKLRPELFNIDSRVCDELNTLFINLWQ